MHHMNVSWPFVALLTVVVAIFIVLAASWSSSVQRESERDACTAYSEYVNC